MFVLLCVGEKKLRRSRRALRNLLSFSLKQEQKEQKWNARNSFTLTRLRTWSCQMTQISNSWKKSYLHWRTEVCMFRSNEAPTLETFHNCSTSIIFRFVSQHCLRITVYIYFQACQFRQEVQFTMLHVSGGAMRLQNRKCNTCLTTSFEIIPQSKRTWLIWSTTAAKNRLFPTSIYWQLLFFPFIPI